MRMLRLRHGLATALAACFVVACGGDGRPTSLEDVLEHPDRFLGEQVTIESEVSRPIDHRVWEMAGGKLFVVYDRGLDRGLEEGERLRVEGTVRPFDKETIEGELGVNIEDHFFTEPFLADDTVVVAETVTRLG